MKEKLGDLGEHFNFYEGCHREQNAILLAGHRHQQVEGLAGPGRGHILRRGPTLLLQAPAGEGLRCDEDEDPSQRLNNDFKIGVIPGLTRNPISEAGFPLSRE